MKTGEVNMLFVASAGRIDAAVSSTSLSHVYA
jgi:hypothetical protein